MGGSVIQLTDCNIAAIDTTADAVLVRFLPAQVIKSQGVPGVDASTRWTQSAIMTFNDAEIEGKRPNLPAVVAGGKITVNRLSYVDMIPIPLEAAGFIRLVMRFGDAELAISGTAVKLELFGHGRYIEHIPGT